MGKASLPRALWLIAALTAGATPSAASAQPGFVQDGEAGFVIADFKYALSKDANETGACPDGMTTGLRDAFQRTEEGRRLDGETDQDYSRRIAMGARAMATGPNGENACQDPEAFPPDANFKVIEVPNIPAYGIDIDGVDSRADGPAAPGSCPHDDFVGLDGERGIDNQLFRVVGCSNSFQSTGQSNTNVISILAGEYGMVIRLRGVDDIRNDSDVQVGIYENADPISLSPSREPLAYATYAMTQDPRFRAETRGRIENGVLTTDPVDIRVYKVTNAMFLERTLKEARLRMTLSEDGVLEGIMAGYTPVEDLYDFQYGYRNGRTKLGELASLRARSGSSNGSAAVNNHTCPGAYHALYAAADAHPDENGRCTAISTQYWMKAIPAFLVDVDTTSVNQSLSD